MISGVLHSPKGTIEGVKHTLKVKNQPNSAATDIAAVSVLCNDANIIKQNSPEGSSKTYECLGEPTEAALCVLVKKLGGKWTGSESAPSIHASANVNASRAEHPRKVTLITGSLLSCAA